MTTAEVISIVSSTVAGLSLVFNVVQAVVNYKLNRRNVEKDMLLAQANIAKDALKDTLKKLLARLEYTQVFTVPYDDEIWESGFASLQELAGLCAAAHVASQYSPYCEASLRDAVSELHDHVKGLRSLRDSYFTFVHGKKGPPADLQKAWPQLTQAEAARKAAGPSAEKCKRIIGRFLSQS
jgi:hypothetical protein